MKEPFINHMFPDIYGPPWESYFKKRVENVVLFSHYERVCDERYHGEACDVCGRQECIMGECEDYDENDPEILEIWENRKKAQNMTLQDLINSLPEGVTPDQVKFSLSIDVGAMSVNGAEISFFHSKQFEDDPEGFKKAQDHYNECYRLYEIERAKYDKWLKEKEIKELEEKLSNLKK